MTRAAARRQGPPPGLWGFLLLVPSLFLLATGIRAWLAASQNRAPEVVTYARFMQRMPKSGWYTIQGGVVDISRSVYWEQNGVCVAVYAPLLPNGASRRADSAVYVEIDAPSTRSVFQDMLYAKRKGGEEAARRFMEQHRETFLQRRDVSGLVSYGMRDPMGEWARAGLDAASVTFLADGWQPNWPLAYGGTAAGAVLTLLCLGLLARHHLRGRS